MADFYFTYGSDERFPFYGGWTRITAPSINVALSIFASIHPNRDNCLNCADYYTEKEFKQTEMYKTQDNRGYGEQEHIALDIEYPNQKKDRRERQFSNGLTKYNLI